jgi:O-antigen polysaccharide polymerase Wzy
VKGSKFASRRSSSGGERMPLHPGWVILPPAAVTAAMWATSGNAVSPTSLVCAHVILQAAWGSYLLWKERIRGGLPMFAMIASIYWIFFAVSLFWGGRTLLVFAGRLIEIGDDYVTQTMIMALIGVICLWAGMNLPFETPSAKDLPDIDESASSSLAYLRIVLVATTSIGLYAPAIYLLGAEGRQVMIVLSTSVPAAAFLLLLRRCWMGTASPVDKPLLLANAAIRIAGSLASGWLGPVISLGLTVVALYLVIRGTIPWTPILLTVGAIFFLQVGKEEFRSVYWGDTTGDVLERAEFWVNTSASKWADALGSGGSNNSGQLASRTMQRASLLTQVAHVVELTPSQVPFQNGQTYSYFAVTLIPRLVWPDKPSVSEANRFYQLAYGLSDSRTVESTSIAVGSMAEGYINFGWLGVILVMFGLGVVLRVYERLCTADQTNTLVLAIGISLLPQLLTIESQLGQYLAGMVQQIILTFAIFLPVTRWKSRTAARVVVPAFRFREHPAQPPL